MKDTDCTNETKDRNNKEVRSSQMSRTSMLKFSGITVPRGYKVVYADPKCQKLK
ncbi:MAG TPA: hypothetical protein VHP31_09145 [Caproicibacter sp.]|nr:hypothetical protein [Caproicibacter sp.]